jgi:hypothetical protein
MKSEQGSGITLFMYTGLTVGAYLMGCLALGLLIYVAGQ